MEMYADIDSRAGVLEPEDMVGIKYRREKLLGMRTRLDTKCRTLREQLSGKTLDESKPQEISCELGQREKLLLPIYNQISVQFANLHDISRSE